ncbi:MAG: exo-alpha-sialidase, partial [Victivallales bacterium]|nr:exo-alpha-sialidase [Victivallales bacterium]
MPPGCPGACVKSPWSEKWLTAYGYFGFSIGTDPCNQFFDEKSEPGVYLFESAQGPDGGWSFRQIDKRKGCCMRQPMPLRHRKRWILPLQFFHGWEASSQSAVMYSDDDGATWRTVEIPLVPAFKVKPPHQGLRWENSGVEPAVAELSDGTLYMLLRTSQDHHYECRSYDGGESWTTPEPSIFFGTITMPNLLTLQDGRLVAIWNNTTPLPELDHRTQPGLGPAEWKGYSEDVFTNRDALHAAISEDDGRTWRGFREILLNDIRDATDFRRHGGGGGFCVDKSVQQSQALETEGGKVLLSIGQHPASAKMVLFDPDFLYETTREEHFAA